MKIKFKYLLLALFAVLTCVSLSSCGSDDDPNKGIGNYYIQLGKVECNLVDANGNNLNQTFMDEWDKSSNADANGKMAIGKIDKDQAQQIFDNYISSFIEVNNNAYAGKNLLPENGVIYYYFYLGSDASYGGATDYAVILIDNDGARLQ